MPTTDYGSNLFNNAQFAGSSSAWTYTGTGGGIYNNINGGRFKDTATSPAGRKVGHTTVTVTPNQQYALSGVTYEQHDTTDLSRFGLRVEWRNSSNAVVGTTWTNSYALTGVGVVTPISRVEFTAPATADKMWLFVTAADTAAFEHYATYFVFKKAAVLPTVTAPADATIQFGEELVLDAGGTAYWKDWQTITPGAVMFGIGDPVTAGPYNVTGEFLYRVTGTDTNGLSVTDDVTITVVHGTPPVTDAGPARTCFNGQSVTLNGSATAPNGGPASWLWTEVSTSGVPITSPTAQSTSVGPFPDPGTYTFKLKATDNTGLVNYDTVTVTVALAPAEYAPLAEKVRLQLSADLRTNYISNHSGQDGTTTGWTQEKGTLSAVNVTGGNNGKSLRLITDAQGEATARGTDVLVMPGEFIIVGLTANTNADSAKIIVYLEFLNEEEDLILGIGGTTDWIFLNGNDAHIVSPPRDMPVGTVKVRTRIKVEQSQPAKQVDFYNVYFYKGSSYPDLLGLTFVENGELWQDLIADSTSISIDRGAEVDGVVDKNRVGLLTARLTNAETTPDKNVRMRPGHKIRVTAYHRINQVFEPVFVGTIDEADSNWSEIEPVVTITATDAISDLAKPVVPTVEGGTFADRVASVMDTVSVLYDVADTATPAPTGAVISVDQSGTALSQLELITNTEHGQFYCRKDGVIQLRAVNSISTVSSATSATFSDASSDVSATDYHTADVSFDSRSLVNSLLVNLKTTGDSDTVLGPYSVINSIQEWGIQTAEVDVISGTGASHASHFLGTLSEPKLTCRSLRFTASEDLLDALSLELFQGVRVKFAPAGLDALFRIISLKHDISPGGGWEVEVGLRPQETVAVVTVGVPALGAETGPADTLPVENQSDTGWVSIDYASGYSDPAGGGHGPMQIRRIGKAVYLRGGVTKNSGSFTAGSYSLVNATVLATHWRPADTIRFGVGGLGGRACLVQVGSDGEISVTSALNTTGATWSNTVGSWAVE